MKTKEQIKQALSISNRTYCPKCKTLFYSVFDRLYIEKFGKCFECDEENLDKAQRDVNITIITNMIEKL